MKSEHICDWLRDAHAMEQQAEKLFSGQSERLKDYVELSTKLKDELTYVTANQILLAGLIKKLGSSTSIIKDSVAKFVAFEQNMRGALMSDEPVKGILALHTFTQMAVGSYKILVSAADEGGESDIKATCETLLASSQRRADWIERELDKVTRSFLTAEAA